MDSITVAARFRPLSDIEKQFEYHRAQKSKIEEIWRIIPSPHNVVTNTQTKNNYYYDHVFPETTSNHEVFQRIARPYINTFIEGTNLTIETLCVRVM